MTDDLAALDATAQADLVRTKELTPRELVEAAILRIEKLDGELNAVIHRRFDRALAEADSPELPDGPFKGVPFLVKDLGASEKGEPFHWGMRALKESGYTAAADSYLVERFRAAGFVSVGRTNTPELGLVPTTEPEAYGATHNPWDTSRTPGGSSGGAAAAVAAGLVPAAHASDGGGSIRIPASMCGLVGLKTSRGRITLGPTRAESGLSVELVHTTSVRDTAAILDAVHGPAAGDNVVAPPPSRLYADEVGADPGKLRVGILATSPRGSLHPECEAAVRATAALLERAGHDVEESHPAALDEQETAHQFTVLWATGARAGVVGAGQLIGRELGEADVEPLTWALASMASGFTALDYANALQAASLYARRMASWWESGFDVLLTPTIADLPPKLGDLTPDPAAPLGAFTRAGVLVPFTPPFNMTGQPAINLPLHESADGLPVGVQLVAGYGREDLLLRVAGQLEAAAPWAGRRAALHA